MTQKQVYVRVVEKPTIDLEPGKVLLAERWEGYENLFLLPPGNRPTTFSGRIVALRHHDVRELSALEALAMQAD